MLLFTAPSERIRDGLWWPRPVVGSGVASLPSVALLQASSSLALASLCSLAVACHEAQDGSSGIDIDKEGIDKEIDKSWIHDEAFLHAYKELRPEDHKEYDPIAVLIPRPNDQWSFEWPEALPGKSIRRRTNSRGFGRDSETSIAKSGFRVLVSGDSHTEGVVSNEDSFPNLLERALNENTTQGAEVLNAGVGYAGPHCYLGALRKNLDLQPDVFIATVFAGNDFL